MDLNFQKQTLSRLPATETVFLEQTFLVQVENKRKPILPDNFCLNVFYETVLNKDLSKTLQQYYA